MSQSYQRSTTPDTTKRLKNKCLCNSKTEESDLNINTKGKVLFVLTTLKRSKHTKKTSLFIKRRYASKIK